MVVGPIVPDKLLKFRGRDPWEIPPEVVGTLDGFCRNNLRLEAVSKVMTSVAEE